MIVLFICCRLYPTLSPRCFNPRQDPVFFWSSKKSFSFRLATPPNRNTPFHLPRYRPWRFKITIDLSVEGDLMSIRYGENL